MTEQEKMLSGRLYTPQGLLPEISRRARRLTRLFNATTEDELETRLNLLHELFAHAGKDIYVEPTFRCDYGSNISVGDYFYANYDCVMVDTAKITIGSHVLLGPRVGIYTAGHPIDAQIRNTGLEFSRPVTIGDSVWVGGNVVINPGVNIGSDVVIGSGSVVTKDIPSHVIAVGSPCRVLRAITAEDKAFWEEKQKEHQE